jgi:hypothetical protein
MNIKCKEPYTGPFPRKKHSHKCLGCVPRGQLNAVACYKVHCTKPKVTDTCEWCNPKCPN